MAKFRIKTIEWFEVRAEYDDVDADTLAEALEKVRSGEVAYDNYEKLGHADIFGGIIDAMVYSGNDGWITVLSPAERIKEPCE